MSKLRIGNTELISTLNIRLVLQAIRALQPTFRAEVARWTGLKPATITAIVNNLIAQEMLREVPGAADNSARFGRPPLMLEFNGDIKRILAIDLEPDHLRVACTDLLARIVEYREQSIDRFSEPRPVIQHIVRLAKEVIASAKRKEIHGVGVSLPGLIDQENGILISSTNMPKWRDVPIGPMLQKELRLPVRIERSLHLAALYEKWSNPREQGRTTVIISLRTGIGMSLVHRGQLYRGSNGLSGEIGHTVVDIDGPPCECGSRGCLETFVSASSVVRRGQELLQTGKGAALAADVQTSGALTPELIYGLAARGDEGCVGIVRDVGRYIGIAVANMINLLGPDEVVICGAIDTAEEQIMQAVQEQIRQTALPRSREHVQVRAAVEKDRLPLLGAAVLIAEDVFELPELRHADAREDQLV